MKVNIGTSVLTKDLVWCECGRGLSLSGKWLYCPTCGQPIDQESYVSAVKQAKLNGASLYYRDPEDRSREMVASFMISRGIATGHGDSVEALLGELGAYIDESRDTRLRLMEALKNS